MVQLHCASGVSSCFTLSNFRGTLARHFQRPAIADSVPSQPEQVLLREAAEPKNSLALAYSVYFILLFYNSFFPCSVRARGAAGWMLETYRVNESVSLVSSRGGSRALEDSADWPSKYIWGPHSGAKASGRSSLTSLVSWRRP